MSRPNIIFDSQVLNAIQLCGYKLWLEFEKHYRPDTVATPFEEGDLLHKMLEMYYLAVKEHGVALLYSNEEFKSFIEKVIAFGEEYALTNKDLTPEETSAVLYQFQEYTEHYRMDGLTVLEVEKPFIINLYEGEELGIYYTGKKDLVANDPEFGIVDIDHKKAARTQRPSSLSNQFTGYAYSNNYGVEVPYVIVNKVGFQKTLSREERFRRYPLPYSKDQLERWKNNTIYWGKQYAFYIENDTWPENRTSCDKYAGCIFQPHCESVTEEARQHLLNTRFVIGEPWDVTAVLKKETSNG